VISDPTRAEGVINPVAPVLFICRLRPEQHGQTGCRARPLGMDVVGEPARRSVSQLPQSIRVIADPGASRSASELINRVAWWTYGVNIYAILQLPAETSGRPGSGALRSCVSLFDEANYGR